MFSFGVDSDSLQHCVLLGKCCLLYGLNVLLLLFMSSLIRECVIAVYR